MSKHWTEPLDPERHKDFMSTRCMDGVPRSVADPLIPGHSYFVRECGFTFEFASIDQVRECLAFFREKTHPTRREPAPGVWLEHYWQRWFERLPKGLIGGTKRERVVRALERALEDFER